MRPAMVHESILEERQRLGHDRFDEVWDGVIHMVPYPTTRHQRVVLDLSEALGGVARRRGLIHFFEIGLYPAGSPGHRNYRGPDCVIVDRAHVSERGIEGHAHLVVEVISPGDESRKKLGFYAGVGVRDIWLVDPTKRSIEVFACDEGVAVPAEAVAGVVASPALGVELTIIGTQLHVRDGDTTCSIELDPVF